ncbi:hypothetical protein [Haloarcula hispanica]|uniref:hypothetical protein n=1 Tax=Haloarcula hispanica TaxID=51589 RepID=UPI001CD9554C|nr:hypothetical protein [Haloarcula hispanica]
MFPPETSEGVAAATILNREEAVPESLPAAELENVQLLPHRTDLLEYMPTSATAAGFGTGDGSPNQSSGSRGRRRSLWSMSGKATRSARLSSGAVASTGCCPSAGRWAHLRAP